MDIKEIREKKARVEKEIARILNDFNEETGLVIEGLTLTHIRRHTDDTILSTYVEGRIEI